MGRGDLATLVRICDPAGRPCGTGFAVDDRGTVVTSHEAVEGLDRIVLRVPGGGAGVAAGVTLLPEADLALVRTAGLGLRPLPVAVRDRPPDGAYVRIPAGGWREARVLGEIPATYTVAGRAHPLDGALELAVGTEGSDALGPGGTAAGGPVVDTRTGSVVAVLAGTASATGHPVAGLAVPLRTAAARDPGGPLAALLRHNSRTVAGFGADLNLAGARRLAAVSLGPARPVSAGEAGPEPVERPCVVREFDEFEASPALVLALTGAPGSGRTTELAALATRRAHGTEPAVSIRLRGADLSADDRGVADAVARALARSGRVVAGVTAHRSGPRAVPAAGAEAAPEHVARVAREAGRPLFVLLDGPEEMPAALAARLPDWTVETTRWLRGHGVRLVLACRPEYWERTAPLYQAAGVIRPALHLGPLTEQEAVRARTRLGLPAAAPAAADARHPLALTLLAEVREALPGDVPGQPSREDVLSAHTDLMCLRAATRIAGAAGTEPDAAAVRRLAARVAGRVHEAARHCLAQGEGGLDRETFGDLFPWRTGWASAVLATGLLVPAGGGYRFAHEEVAEWLQAAHLDVDTVLHPLLRRADPTDHAAADGGAPALPRHRKGTVVQALLLLDRRSGEPALAPRLAALVDVLEGLDGSSGSDVPESLDVPDGFDGRTDPGSGPDADVRWWAAGLLRETLLRVPRARRYLGVLRTLADRITRRSLRRGGPRRPAGPGEFGPSFWQALHIGEAERIDLLRRLVPADGPPERAGAGRGGAAQGTAAAVDGAPSGHGETGPAGSPRDEAGAGAGEVSGRGTGPAGSPSGTGPAAGGRRHEEPGAVRPPRYLDAVAERLARSPRAVQPLLCRWFTDDRPLPAAPGAAIRPTVAAAAQALLHTHRGRAVDDLCEALVSTVHPRARELLAALAEDEPSAVCRAVDRWAHDDTRPVRRLAAATYAPLVAARVTGEGDRDLLRYAALALLARPADSALHGAALAVLVRDPRSRPRYLTRALDAYRHHDPGVPADVLVSAATTHPEPVFAAFRAALHRPGDGAGDVLRALAALGTPALARRAAGLVSEYVGLRPAGAPDAAAFVGLRLRQGASARAVLLPLVVDLLRGRPVQVRCAVAAVLGTPGGPAGEPLRIELLDVLLEHERYTGGDPEVLDALLQAAVCAPGRRPAGPRVRELVHRVGLLLVRTPEGANRFDRRLVELARQVPGFAAEVVTWQAAAPREWAVVIGPSTRRTLEALGSQVPMPTAIRGHGSLRPA
ncbi:trypsin-like peptidase domain-containing protein [Streptomyces marianii]|uniref:Trypsin-like peptidase domain-containing protein n=1 Tax=Streptomyces marianii TaxID=1817406 RepID=A0A5R9E0A6_9ACTN|nr:trypsin-like peptidase domain-containing protein [Streptomyces marianii]TLQ43371.1 trypsin-like peptidase domain-containing protein [Streptomyces marianii]